MNAKERRELLAWAEVHRCCCVCWWPESDGRRKLDVHHLVGGAGRKHDIRNYARLCTRCHEVLHSGTELTGHVDLNKRILLTAKRDSDPENYDPEFLASLKMKKHLGYDPEPIPDYYLKERELNVQGWPYRKP